MDEKSTLYVIINYSLKITLSRAGSTFLHRDPATLISNRDLRHPIMAANIQSQILPPSIWPTACPMLQAPWRDQSLYIWPDGRS